MNSRLPGLSVLSALLLIFSHPVCAQDDAALSNQIRQQIIQTINPEELGIGYGAMANFAVVPDISAARYNIDSDGTENTALRVRRFPIRFYLPVNGENWRTFLQGNIGVQKFSTDFSVLESDSISSEWDTDALSLIAGIDVRLADNFYLTPAIDVGRVRIDNIANYSGDLATSIIKPAFDNVLFNFNTDARLLGVSMGLNYQARPEFGTINVHSSLTHNNLETYNSSSQYVEFDSAFTTLTASVEMEIPTDLTINEFPIALIPQIGGASFIGANRGAFGFDDYLELGLAASINISALDYLIREFRVGAKGIWGNNMNGWTLLFGYRF